MSAGHEGFIVERLDRDHQRDTFDCGSAPLNDYLKIRASQDVRKIVATTYVLVQVGQQPKIVAGYYSLASTSIHLDDLPVEVAEKLPRYPAVPGTLLARLAVDRTHKRKRLGELLLIDALRRSSDASREVASTAVFVDAKDDEAAAFYRRYGFLALPDQPLRLFLTMKTIEKMFAN